MKDRVERSRGWRHTGRPLQIIQGGSAKECVILCLTVFFKTPSGWGDPMTDDRFGISHLYISEYQSLSRISGDEPPTNENKLTVEAPRGSSNMLKEAESSSIDV